MNMHAPRPSWRDATVAAKIELVEAVFTDGMSASGIAAAVRACTLENVSRNAIIGLFYRHGDKIPKGVRLRARMENLNTTRPKRKRRAPARRGNIPSRPEARADRPKQKQRPPKERLAPVTDIEADEYDAASLNLSLADLEVGQCRWPTGQADGGHRFCGHRVHKLGWPYCHHHARRSVAGRVS